MLKNVLIGLALTFPVTACCVETTKNQDVMSLTNELRNAREFWLYFVTRTEDYSLTIDQIKTQSSIRIYRRCGANCANTLNIVIQHLREAKPVTCLAGAGMENVLLELSPGKHVVYSHAGRQVRVNGHCYLSGVSINKVLDQTGYIFK